jgi:intracellular multiplication protein IcmK
MSESNWIFSMKVCYLRFVLSFAVMTLSVGNLSGEHIFDGQSQLSADAFDSALEKFFPLSPDQIELIYNAYEQKLEVSSLPYAPVPMAVTSTRNLSLSPGSEIPLVRLSKGYISSIIFLDQTGQPWPIANYSLGNPEAFDINWDRQSNTLFIQSMKVWAFANIGIRLQGLSTPIMMNLVSSEGEVDYRLDFNIPELGPFAKESVRSFDENPFDNKLLAYLDGAPPRGALPLFLDPDIGQAWFVGGKIILRVKDTLLSPQWSGQTQSSDGTKVYEINRTNTIVVSRKGSPKTVTIKGL